MKRTKGIFLALIIITTVLLGGCGATEPAENTEPPTVNEKQNKSEESKNESSYENNSETKTEDNKEQNVSSSPEPLNLEKDFIYLNIAPEEADELFGESLSARNENNFIYRTYQDGSCTFKINEDGKNRLTNLWILTPGYAPVFGIGVGDSLESVLSKIVLTEVDNITYGIEMYYYVLSDDMTFFTNTYDTYIGTTVSFSNWSDSYTVKGALEIDFDENDEVYLIRVILY